MDGKMIVLAKKLLPPDDRLAKSHSGTSTLNQQHPR
jgi:hypothetical protein